MLTLTNNFNDNSNRMANEHALEMKTIQAQWNEVFAFYDEKAKNIQYQRNKIKFSCEDTLSRRCELDQMRKLNAEARIRLDLVQKAAKDLSEYRWMMQARDKNYNSQFGKDLTVGIYDLRSPRTLR